MARCPNRNAPEYAPLLKKYKNVITVDSIINKWQDYNVTDLFPTTSEAEQYLDNRNAAYSLKTKEFEEALVANLRKKGMIHRSSINGKLEIYTNNTPQRNQPYIYAEPATNAEALNTAKKNFEKVLDYLRIHGIPENYFIPLVGNRSVRLVVNEDAVTPKDIIEITKKSARKMSNNTLAIIEHLNKLFPQVNINVVDVETARSYWESLPMAVRGLSNKKFNQVNSFYYRGNVVLIKGRINNEIAIEEVLHPFINALSKQNPELFDSILTEVEQMFPVMSLQIEEAYSGSDVFNYEQVQLEKVTQALSRHFLKEYEENPTESWTKKIKDLFDFFMTILKDLHKYISGKNLKGIRTASIRENATLSDLAKLLNTSDISFDVSLARKDKVNKVQYSLSPAKKAIVDKAMANGNELQKKIIAQLFGTAEISPEEIDFLTATGARDGQTIIILNEDDHTYYDIKTGQAYLSATTAIKGVMPENIKEDKKVALDLGNDFDFIIDGIAAGVGVEVILPEMKVLMEEDVRKAYNQLEISVNHFITDTGFVSHKNKNIILPQVILFDEKTGIAGTVDLLVIRPDGSVRIIDLKTSKNSIDSTSTFTKGLKYDVGYKLAADSLIKKMGLADKLSTRQQHNLQVNLYRRMAENMGLVVDNSDMGSSTYHIHVPWEEGVDFDKKGKFTGTFTIERQIYHPESQNEGMMDKIMPQDKSSWNADQLQKTIDESEEGVIDDTYLTEEESGQIPSEILDAQGRTEYGVIFDALQDFKQGLIKRKDALLRLRSAITLDKTRSQAIDEIDDKITAIEVASLDATGKHSSAEFTRLVQDSIREIDKFIEYMNEPKNFGTQKYINYALNFEKFIKTYSGLQHTAESEDVNPTQLRLLRALDTKLRVVGGYVKTGGEVVEGLVDKAIFNYVQTYVKEHSTRDDLTPETLDDIMRMAEDIGITEYATYDISSSRDTLLALMDKLYKAKKQELLDKIDMRETRIRVAASQIAKYSPGVDSNTWYDFMLEFDNEGVPTGFYVQKIGRQYYDIKNGLYDDLFDTAGNKLEYRNVEDVSTADIEDIEYNKALKTRKTAFAIFMQAEKIEDGKLKHGRYHKYTQEFIDVRKKFERFEKVGDTHGYWKQKNGISDQAYQKYLVKYYDIIPVQRGNYTNGEFDGSVYDSTMYVVKRENKEIREDAGGVESMVSEKWNSIMNPTTALEQAQKEFYEMYTEVYQELLEKLPMGTRDKMLGRMPLVKNTFFEQMKDKPSAVTKMFARMSRGTRNLFTDTANTKRVILDEDGKFTDQLPIYFIGSPRTEQQLEKVLTEMEALNEKFAKGVPGFTRDEYDVEMKFLKGEEIKIRQSPTKEELSRDLADSLLRFAGMAEHYETMGQAEDTIHALLRVIEKRTYTVEGNRFYKYIKGKKYEVGSREGKESNVYKRAKKWMHMVFYNNDDMSKSVADKMTEKVIRYSSLSYVAWNPFGNINNYTIARINNGIEVAGARFFSRKAYARATGVFNARVMQDTIKRTAFHIGKMASGQYDQYEAQSKYEAFVELYRMMDNKADIRETGYAGKQGLFSKFLDLGYLLQDGAEYNVQTKVGMAMIMDVQMRRSQDGPGGETLSLYDAMEFDSVTHKLKFKEGFDEIAERNSADSKGERTWKKFDEQWRYQFRNKIREVNKQIHGNYAHEDRMVIQSHWSGQLIAQFHKWVAPAIKARYRKEYFDENIGWLEGRYRSTLKLSLFLIRNLKEIKNLNEQFKKEYGEGNRAQMKILNAWRTAGETALFISTLAIKQLLLLMWEDDKDDGPIEKKLKNALLYQADRSQKEMIQFLPFHPTGMQQIGQMMKSPMAATRTLGEIGEAIETTIKFGYYGIMQPPEEFYKNSTIYYQRKPRKGQSKVAKEWGDAVPIYYGIQKWMDFQTRKDYYIK